MDQETAQALEKSIKHWEENVECAREGRETDIRQSSCALCNLFFHKECVGCPVSEKTGTDTCKLTPYDKVFYSRGTEEHLSVCIDELNFLKSLREEQHEEKSTNMIDMKKTYTTRDGKPVRIYAVDAGSDYPVHGAYLLNSVWYPCMWPANGLHNKVASDYDLIEAHVTLQMWVNVYEMGIEFHDDRALADYCANDGRIACVPVTITYRHGDGLDNDK